MQPLAHAIRRSLLIETTDRAPAAAGPGMLIVTGDGRIESATEPARRWLEELAGDLVHDDGDRLPAAVFTVALRSLRVGTEPHASRVRLRTAVGTWLTIYASPLRGPDGVERAAVDDRAGPPRRGGAGWWRGPTASPAREPRCWP